MRPMPSRGSLHPLRRNADVCLIPEMNINLEKLMDYVTEVADLGIGFFVGEVRLTECQPEESWNPSDL